MIFLQRPTRRQNVISVACRFGDIHINRYHQIERLKRLIKLPSAWRRNNRITGQCYERSNLTLALCNNFRRKFSCGEFAQDFRAARKSRLIAPIRPCPAAFYGVDDCIREHHAALAVNITRRDIQELNEVMIERAVTRNGNSHTAINNGGLTTAEFGGNGANIRFGDSTKSR